MAQKFPRTAKRKFTVSHDKNQPDPEGYGEGFCMTVQLTGTHFRIGIQLPKEAVHGPAYIIFYASFWEPNGLNSIIETGLSFSADPTKRLNMTAVAKATVKKAGKSVHESDHHSLAKDVKGQYYELDVTFKDGHIISTIADQKLVRAYNGEKIGKVHLVIGTADRRGTYFSEAAIRLLKVNGSHIINSGYVEWVNSKNVKEGDSRIVLDHASGTGMQCHLPKEGRLESGPADALGKWMPSAA